MGDPSTTPPSANDPTGADERSPEPHRSRHLPGWLGGRTFWVIALGAFLATFATMLFVYRGVQRPGALVPVVTVTGPSQATPGETVRYAVLVRDRAGAPIPDAPVRIGFRRGELVPLGRGTTGAGGETTIAVRFPDDFAEERTILALADVGVAEGADALTVLPKSNGPPDVFVSTDKPLYQPGQTIHIRALAMAGPAPLAAKTAVLEVKTQDGIKVFREEKPTSAFGVVATDFVLADQVKLGTYRIEVSLPLEAEKGRPAIKATGARDVDVRRYSLPKLKLALEDLSSPTEKGVRGKARATWIFGEPVVKGEVVIDMMNDRRWSTARGVTDKDGVFAFELPWLESLKPQDRRGAFTLRAKLTAPGGITSEASERIQTKESGTLAVEAFPESGALVMGVTQKVFVVVTGGEPDETITVRAAEGTGAKTSAPLSARKVAILSVRPEVPPPGAPVTPITIVAEGNRGSEGKVATTPTAGMLVLRPDSEVFTSSEAARVSVFGAEVGDHVSLRMTKGSEPIALGSCIVKTPEAGCDVELSVPKETSGLVWLHALSLPLAGHEVKSGKRLGLVSGGDRDLAVTVTPERAIFAPRDKGFVDISVTSASGPTAAQLGVTIADEAVFALANVRPDLEKAFFTTDKDVARTRRPAHGYSQGSSSEPEIPEHPAPVGFNARRASDPGTDADVRAVTLAALTTMPDVGAAGARSKSSIAKRAEEAVEDRVGKLKAWSIVLVTIYALGGFLFFALYGWSRHRSPVVPPVATQHIDTFRRETRGLYVDWLVAALGPPSLLFATAAASELLGGGLRDTAAMGEWLVLAFFCSALLVRGVLRVRRTTVALATPSLRRALFLLPVAALLAHVALLLVALDQGRQLRLVFVGRNDYLVLPTVLVGAAQITCGVLSVVRQTLLRDVTARGRLWLLVSRASFLGLPLTLAFGIFLLVEHVRLGPPTWNDRELGETAADNKEGGTGTRAKGEEGSLANPSAPGAMSLAVGLGGGPVQGGGAGKTAPQKAVVRDYFPETLLWAPEVLTDDAGRAKLEVPFADAITTWRFALSAVSKTGQLGVATLPLVVKQDFFVDASLPPVLTQGDEIAMPVTVFSYTPEAEDVTVEVEGDGISTAGASRMVLHLAPNEARGARFTLRADRAGERTVRIKATGRTHADALERKVTVTPNGLEVVRTTNGSVIGTTTSAVELPAGAIDGGDALFVKIYGGPLSQLSEGLDGVFTMPHGCFEQTSSTTYPSVLALEFLERAKAVSPAVEKKARRYIGLGYQRLLSFEVPGGGFSLFGGAPASTTLSAYGLLELSDMSRVASVDESVLVRTRDWLYAKQSPNGGWATPASYDDPRWRGMVPPDDLRVSTWVAWALATAAEPPSKGGTARSDSRLAGVLEGVARASGAEANEAYTLALRANALLAGGRAAEAKPILERLASMAVRDEGGVHWTSSSIGVMHSSGASMSVELTGLAAHALARAELHPELRAGALSWLVSQRSVNGTWSTTQATIAAMRALLDEAKPVPKEPQDVTVIVDGDQAETFHLEPAARDVHHLIGLRRWARTGSHAVTIRATGGGDVGFQLVSRHWLPWQRQAPGAVSPLTLDVAYAAEAVRAGETTSCRVHLSWRGKEAARMPLLEIGVPPAFDVDTTDLEKLVASGKGIQHYTVERNRVTLYLLELQEDKPLTIDLPLRALRPARVVVPASTAYLYYEPEVRSETRPVTVRSL